MQMFLNMNILKMLNLFSLKHFKLSTPPVEILHQLKQLPWGH